MSTRNELPDEDEELLAYEEDTDESENARPLFTPGPWECFYKPKYNEWHVGVPENGPKHMRTDLFSDGVPTQRAEHDAKLIAAAPDMYALLREIVEDCLLCEELGESDCGACSRDKSRVKAEELLKKIDDGEGSK